jgi:hypothetical protein
MSLKSLVNTGLFMLLLRVEFEIAESQTQEATQVYQVRLQIRERIARLQNRRQLILQKIRATNEH